MFVDLRIAEIGEYENSEMPRGDYIVQAKLTAEGEVLAPTFTIRLMY